MTKFKTNRFPNNVQFLRTKRETDIDICVLWHILLGLDPLEK